LIKIHLLVEKIISLVGCVGLVMIFVVQLVLLQLELCGKKGESVCWCFKDDDDNGDAAINPTAAIGVWLVRGLGAQKGGKHKRKGNDLIATAGCLLHFGL
jgi:hypothetical protein